MDKVGNFKTTALIRVIVIIYLLSQGLLLFIFFLVKTIPNLDISIIDSYEFILSKTIPILIVSVILIYANKFFDKIPWISSMLFEVPVLKGEYNGVVKQREGKEYIVTASIEQTLSSVEFELISLGGSISTSESISFEKHGMNHWKVFINIKNLNTKTPDDTKDYHGTCVLDFNIRNQKLTGFYFTSRQIFGTLELQKIKL